MHLSAHCTVFYTVLVCPTHQYTYEPIYLCYKGYIPTYLKLYTNMLKNQYT